ncbi:MAG TPA: hypothetical protein PKH07_14370, partial [bacterium]|nr:hypothetical protein [bacterium]
MIRKPIGKVISTQWDEQAKRLDFVVEFADNGYRISGSLKSGFDPASGSWVSAEALKKKAQEMLSMKVYDDGSGLGEGALTPERLTNLRLKVSLSSA